MNECVFTGSFQHLKGSTGIGINLQELTTETRKWEFISCMLLTCHWHLLWIGWVCHLHNFYQGTNEAIKAKEDIPQSEKEDIPQSEKEDITVRKGRDSTVRIYLYNVIYRNRYLEYLSNTSHNNIICGVQASMLASNAVVLGLKIQSGQTNDFIIGISCFSSKCKALRS